MGHVLLEKSRFENPPISYEGEFSVFPAVAGCFEGWANHDARADAGVLDRSRESKRIMPEKSLGLAKFSVFQKTSTLLGFKPRNPLDVELLEALTTKQ